MIGPEARKVDHVQDEMRAEQESDFDSEKKVDRVETETQTQVYGCTGQE
jgi:hypothetical protein